MKKTPEELVALANDMFKGQWPLLSLWQTIADHFFPERADFTFVRNVGIELSDTLVDSYPILVRRDLGNSFHAMLRQGDWFKMSVVDKPDYMGQAWLDFATKRQKEFIENRKSGFVKSTKQGDHDYAAFGQCVLSVEMNRRHDGLLFRNWHLRDCAWSDDEAGNVDMLARKWEPSVRDLHRWFKEENLHTNVREKLKDKPNEKVSVYHLAIPVDMYGEEEWESRGFSYVSVFVDIKNNHVIEDIPQRHFMYIVPRFQTISGSPYAYSPATVVGLPDARTLQAMTHTLLEAGERYARPPLIGTQKVVRGDVDLQADGITWVDKDYDEKMGAALRPLAQDRGGFPIGLELRNDMMEVLRSAFYLNKLSLPETNKEMTAYEIQERMKQFRRENLPLFAPLESEYNGRICETAFDVMMQHGLFGSPADIPQSLRSKEVQFKFVSPLSESEEEEKVNRLKVISSLLADVYEYDNAVLQNLDFDTAFRDAVAGTKAPTTWLHSIESVLESRLKDAKQRDIIEQAEEAQAMAAERQASEAAA